MTFMTRGQQLDDKRVAVGKHGCIVYGAMRDWEKICMSLHVQTLVTFQCFHFFSCVWSLLK